MRPSTAFPRTLAVLALFSCGAASLFGQSAATDPVGFVTLNIPGTGGTSPNAISFKALSLAQPVLYQGSAETVNVGAKTLTDQQATWTDNLYNGANGAHYIEIIRPVGQLTSAPGEGTTYDILSTNQGAKTITTVQPLAAGIVDGALFRIRKHWTIGGVFGATNSAGFKGSDDVSTADVLQIWNGGGFDVFFYQVTAPAFGGTGWRSPNDLFADASGTIISPDDGLVFKLQQNNAVNVVLTGAVKTGQTSSPVLSGFNIVANVYAAPMTLATSGLQTSGLTGSDDSSTADQVMLWNGSGYDVFYYQVAAAQFGGTGWRSPNDLFADAGPTQLPLGNAVIVKRLAGTAFNWVMPQHPASF